MLAGASSAAPSRQLTPSLSSSSQQSQSQGSSNPLSIRLYKVLAANFDDDATKDALNTLSELYSSSPTTSGVPNGKKKAKDVGGDDSDGDEEEDDSEGEVDSNKRRFGHSVYTVAGETIPGEIAGRARKNLKRDVEAKLAESSRRFLHAFAEVDKVGTYTRWVTCALICTHFKLVAIGHTSGPYWGDALSG